MPSRASGPQTKEQWIADQATSLTLRFLNGTAFSEPQMTNAYWDAHGIPILPQEYRGSAARNPDNAQDPMVYNRMLEVATAMANEGGTNLPSGGPILTADEEQNKFTASENAANRANTAAIAGMQEAGANSRNAASIAESNFEANLRATVDRESIASNERTATADRSSRESIASADRAEQGREFDLSQVEDRRQFNVTTLTHLLDTGVELSRNPVDWLAYQFYMQNMGIPMTYLNATSVASQLGAVPPTGPSSIGPVVGGPAAVDGDAQLATQIGVQPALVPVSQAVQTFPGGNAHPELQQLTAGNQYANWMQQAGGTPQALDAAVDSERQQKLPATVGNNQVVQQWVANVTSNAAIAPTPPAGGNVSREISYAADQLPNGTPPTPPAPPVGGPGWDPNSPGAREAILGNAAPGGAPIVPGWDPNNIPAIPPTGPIQVGGNVGTAMAAPAPPTVSTGGNTGTNRGVYTGPTISQPAPARSGSDLRAPVSTLGTQGQNVPAVPTATTATAAPSPNANPQGEAMLAALSKELGIPIDQLRQLVPTNLMAGGYSLDTIKQSPIIQSLMNQSLLSNFRTADAGDSKFGTIQAFGIPLGIRGGQDINAQTYLQAPSAAQQQIEGTIKATGQYWPDVQQQMLRASPVTSYQTGSFGTRRFQ